MRHPLVQNKMQKVKMNECYQLSCCTQSLQDQWSLKFLSIITN